MRRLAPLSFALLACTLVSGCMVTQVPLQTSLIASSSTSPLYRLAAPVTMRVGAASDLVLRAGTGWRKTGDLEQGAVYHTADQVVIVNSFHVFEADIVVKDGKAVGFYNPVGKTFIAAQPVAITLTQEN